MEAEIVVTGIVKSGDEFLVVKRSENDDKYPGMWEFPGGHVEDGETIKITLYRQNEKQNVGTLEPFAEPNIYKAHLEDMELTVIFYDEHINVIYSGNIYHYV